MSGRRPLSLNGLIVPEDFPVVEYEAIQQRVERARGTSTIYEEFAGAWNAIAYRFVAVTEYESILRTSLTPTDDPIQRYRQEKDLFGFFSNGFSVFEAIFYGLFALGAFVAPTEFPLATRKDKQKVSPTSTTVAIAKVFVGEPINQVIKTVSADPAYVEWREVRNVLTHRAAPGRTFFVGIGGDEELPDQWKIKDIPLDAEIAPKRRTELARLVTEFLRGIDQFSSGRFRTGEPNA
jgi:hypothetical protein